jgi:uncharacterized protein (TIGR03437 family)
MRHIWLAKAFVVVLGFAGLAPAQVTIGSVMNVGSRLASTSPFYGIAQGSLFAISGRGLGPDPLQQASFPLPTTDGLAGVTVQASVGGATVDCIKVYASSAEVGAILPSGTPIGNFLPNLKTHNRVLVMDTLGDAEFAFFSSSLTRGKK